MKDNPYNINIPAVQYPLFKQLEETKRFWVKGNYKERIYYDPKKKRYYHRDPLHGEVEEYNRLGKHINVLLPNGDIHPKKKADKKKSLKAFI